MKRSTRVLILLLVFELLIIAAMAFTAWNINSGNWTVSDPAELLKRVFQVGFGAMPIIAALLLFIIFSLRRKGE